MKVYVSHSIRGKFGKDATVEQMEANNQKAIEFGKKLRQEFPTIEFYIPGDHDEFVTIAYVEKYITEEQILDVDCEIISGCDFLINYMPDNYLSNGMRVENEYASKHGISIFNVCSNSMSSPQITAIHQYLRNLMKG